MYNANISQVTHNTTKDINKWENFLKPLFGLMIDRKELKESSEKMGWDKESNCFSLSDFVYPEYYRSQNFHGVKGGYLTSIAAVTYDPVTRYVLAPNENRNRETIIKAVQNSPCKILDIGCGTGSTTIMLKQAFPNAEVIGLDLSPQMLIMAERKAQKLGLEIQWQQGLAEATGFANEEFDLVTASLLFHETPANITQEILQEGYRLLSPGGQVIILDGNQKTLRQIPWLTKIFEEPYINQYAVGSLETWLSTAGFIKILTEGVGWTNQLSTGVKTVDI